jgi:oligosaccharyltransferase complex subunit alpha (ribophorin I)
MSIHFENNAPFLTITNLERVIEVSHWGNIAVEETIDLKHSGAALKGPFSRYEYQRETQSGLSSVKSFKVFIMLRRLHLIHSWQDRYLNY